jgi:uncharacterized delta-60 repeat protein
MQTTSRSLTAVWPLVILLLLPALTRAETAVQAWVQRYNGPGNTNDYTYALAVDSSNNVIVTGYWDGDGADTDYATIKYSSAGVPLWTNLYHGPGNGANEGWAVAADSSNNVIVTGISYAGGGWPSYDYDYTTIKYSGDGVSLWTNRYGGPAHNWDHPIAVAVDGNSDVIVTGSSVGINSDLDYATIKYSSEGMPLWTNRYDGGGQQDALSAMAVDGSNNIIVTGASARATSGYDYATIKYSSAGVPLWTNRYNGSAYGDDFAYAVAVDGSNNVIVTGYSATTNVPPYNYDYATIKYSSAGEPLWTNRYNGPGNGDDGAYAVAVDGGNNVIVTGYSLGCGSTNDYATIKYSSEGVPLWTNRYNGPGNDDDQAQAVVVDRRDNVIVTGYSIGNGGNYDYTTIKYSSAGVPLWTSRYNGPGNNTDYAFNAKVDGNNNVIVSGYSLGTGGNYDFATIRYICVPEPVVTCPQLTNGTLQLRVDDVLQPGTLVIEASTDLAGWAPVFTNTTPTNVLFYTDPDASNSPARFYRAFQFP